MKKQVNTKGTSTAAKSSYLAHKWCLGLWALRTDPGKSRKGIRTGSGQGKEGLWGEGRNLGTETQVMMIKEE